MTCSSWPEGRDVSRLFRNGGYLTGNGVRQHIRFRCCCLFELMVGGMRGNTCQCVWFPADRVVEFGGVGRL